jgi:hypothetical protein
MNEIHETLKFLLASQLTRRYQDIVVQLPGMILSDGLKANTDIQGLLLGYIDLCNEELLLYRAQQIPDVVWDSWKSGIIAGNSLVSVRKTWQKLAKSDHYRTLAEFLRENGVDVFSEISLTD